MQNRQVRLGSVGVQQITFLLLWKKPTTKATRGRKSSFGLTTAILDTGILWRSTVAQRLWERDKLLSLLKPCVNWAEKQTHKDVKECSQRRKPPPASFCVWGYGSSRHEDRAFCMLEKHSTVHPPSLHPSPMNPGHKDPEPLYPYPHCSKNLCWMWWETSLVQWV